MILYRIGSQLFLHDEDNTSHLIYDGSYGTPYRFFFFSKIFVKRRISHTVFCAIISMPGYVLVNFGKLDQIKQSVWYEHQTNRDDEPIDFKMIFIGIGHGYPSLRFLYSDLTFTVIQFINGKFDVFHQHDLSTIMFQRRISLSRIELPVSKIYVRHSSGITVKEHGDKEIYFVSITGEKKQI